MDTIGICTYYNNYNYGSYLQSYALQSVLEGMGYHAVLIDFNDLSQPWNKRLHYKTILSRLKCILLNPKLIFETLRVRKIKKEQISCSEEQRKKFNKFSKEKLNFYIGDFTQSNIKAFIVGSDQVWKLTLPGLHYVFFLRFTIKRKRISYAASIGTNIIPFYNKKLLNKYLDGFNSISVRESKSVKLLSDLNPGLNVVHVLDPVLLIGKSFWANIVPKIDISEYIILYFLDPVEQNIDLIERIISQNHAHQIVLINSGFEINLNCNVQILNPSPLEFVGLIMNSRAVLTDSFHGTAFSILFGKEFYTFPRNYKIYSGQSDRLISILEMFSCQDRYVTEFFNFQRIRPLSMSSIDEIIYKEMEKSINYLKDSISKSSN